MTIHIVDFEALTIPDGQILTNADLGVTSSASIQPTSGTRWVWDAAAKMPKRTLDTNGNNYVRDDVLAADTRVAMMRWFYWPGADPTSHTVLMACRSNNPVDGQRLGMVITTAGEFRLTYNSGVQIGTTVDMTALPAGYYAIEIQANALASGGSAKGWLYSQDLQTVHGTVSASSLAFTATTEFGRFRFGGAIAGGAWTEDRMPHGIISAVNEPLTDNMLRDAWLATQVSSPTLVVDRPAENVVDARSSTPGAGGTLTYAMAHVAGPDNTAGIDELVEGIFAIPQDPASPSTYSVTATEAPSGLTDTENVVVAAAATVAASIRRRVWDGAAWV